MNHQGYGLVPMEGERFMVYELAEGRWANITQRALGFGKHRWAVRGLRRPLPRQDNWRGDVNEDGRINVLDLIYARNQMGTSRP